MRIRFPGPLSPERHDYPEPLVRERLRAIASERLARRSEPDELAAKYRAALQGLAVCTAGPARRFLEALAEQPAMARGLDLEPLVDGVVAELHVAAPKTVKAVAEMCGSVAIIARYPAAFERVRALAEKVAAHELARGVTPDASAAQALELRDVARPSRPKLAPELDAIVDRFAPSAREVAAWLLADYPKLAADARGLATDAADFPAEHQVWLLNRLRSDAYFPNNLCPPLRLSRRRVVEILASRTAAAPLWSAALTALGEGELQPLVASTLASLSTRALGRLAAALPMSRRDPVMAAIDDELAHRREELAVEISVDQSHLGDILAEPGRSRVLAARDGLDAARRADAFIAAGRGFFGDELVSALRDLAALLREHGHNAKGEPGERIAALRKHCLEILDAKRHDLVELAHMPEELAAALASTVAVSGGDERDRARLFDELVDAVRMMRGAALHQARRATVIADSDRASFATGTVKTQADNTRALHHELGQALEYARADLGEAAAALLARRKIGDTVHPMNDLLVVWHLSWLAGPDSQRRLLERLSRSSSGRPLNSREAIEELAGGLGYEAAIDKLCAGDLGKIRTYAKDEMSFPVLGEPYVGKAYTKGTEIVSMGVDKLVSTDGLLHALLHDAELVCFNVGALLGGAP